MRNILSMLIINEDGEYSISGNNPFNSIKFR